MICVKPHVCLSQHTQELPVTVTLDLILKMASDPDGAQIRRTNYGLDRPRGLQIEKQINLFMIIG
jgi:hypothetical protein